MKFQIINSNNDIIVSNLENKCFNCYELCSSSGSIIHNCDGNNSKQRQGKQKTKKGIIFLCSSDCKTSKLFKERLEILSYSIPCFEILRLEIKSQISDEEKKQTKRLLHNLISLNAHNIQEIYALVPQDLLTANINDQINIIQKHIFSNPMEAAKTYLRVAKHNLSMKTEFTVFKRLYDKNPKLEKKLHPLRKVVLNILHTFFQDFLDKNVHIIIQNNFEKVYIDYESIHVALYHLIDNSVKYTLPNSKLYIDFKNEGNILILEFNMISVKIEDDEINKIFDEGYSGKNTIKMKKEGDGIGLSIVKNLLELNNVGIFIKPNYNIKKIHEGLEYNQNFFNLHFILTANTM